MATIIKRASDVRIQEINLSQILAQASSSVVAIPIVSVQGRTTPIFFSDPNDFVYEYGDENPQVSHSIRCGKDYFNEGNQLWGIRVVGSGARYAAILMYQNGGVTHLKSITEGVVDPLNPDWESLVDSPTDEAIALFYPNRGPGSYGRDFAMALASTTLQPPASVQITSTSTGGLLESSEYTYRVSSISSTGEETLVSGPISIVLSNALATNCVKLSWTPVEGAVGYKVYGRTPGAGLLHVVGGGDPTFTDTGALMPDVSLQPITDPAHLPAPSKVFKVSFYNMATNKSVPVEEYECTLKPFVDSSGTQTELEDRINPFSQVMNVTSNTVSLSVEPTITTVSTKVALGGGDSGSAPTSYNIAKALEVFLNKEQYPINLIINAGFADPIVQRKIDSVAYTRANAIGLLDMPSTKQKPQAAIDYRNLELNLNSSYSGLFCPDVLQADLVNGRSVFTPISGWVAALFARTERIANASYSPAGLNRGLLDVLKARYTYDDGEASALYKAQINYIRTFVGQGIVLWEQQTLSAESSALSYLSVRHLINIIKTSLYQFLLYAIQEPNTEHVGRQVTSSVNDYLDAWVNAGGLHSGRCISDKSNNPAVMANAGIRVVTVILVPVIPIHEIQLQVVVSKQGVTFAEVMNKLTGS